MKKTTILCMLTLALGFFIGILCNYSFIFLGREPTGQTRPDHSPNVIAAGRAMTSLAPAETEPPLDTSGNVSLLQRSGQVLETLKHQDYAALSKLVHPSKGVTFSPYSTVEADIDLCFGPGQIKNLSEDSTRYLWGRQPGSGASIELTMADYIAQYVFNTDYTQSQYIGIDTVVKAGNALENVSDAYPAARFVEYHFPGLVSANDGYDWCSLKLVFEEYQNEWMLVGSIHSEWTS